MVAASELRLSLLCRCGTWDAALLAGAFHLVSVPLAGLLLHSINEAPEAFPAVVLWQFRVASFGRS